MRECRYSPAMDCVIRIYIAREPAMSALARERLFTAIGVGEENAVAEVGGIGRI